MQKRKAKLYTHHNTFREINLAEEFENYSFFEVLKKYQKKGALSFGIFVSKLFLQTSYLTGMFLLNTFYYTGVLVLLSSYLTGLCLVYIGMMPFGAAKVARRITKTQIIQTQFSIADKFQKLRTPQFAFTMVLFISLTVLSASFFQTANLFAFGLKLKGSVLGKADIAIQHFTAGEQKLKDKDLVLAQQEFSKALENFHGSQKEIKETGFLLNTILSVLPAKRGGDRLLIAGQSLSRAALTLTGFFERTKNIKISESGVYGDRPNSEILSDLGDSLNQSLSQIRIARESIDSIDPSIIPEEKRDMFIEAAEKLQGLEKTLVISNSVFDVFYSILSGNKHVLLVFQNNNELRPSGGFIGTYGSFDLNQGHINNLKVSSIYDLDGQLMERIIPPYPMFNVNDHWYMRDSNWFVDFPHSAKVISEFYEKEGGQTPDLVIALTPEIITDLLKLTGPVNMDKYGVVLDSDNFVEMTQVATSSSLITDKNKPKQLLADFIPQFLGKLSDFSHDQVLTAFQALQRNMNAKHILLYSQDEELESKMDSFNWTGKVLPTDRDYLAVYSSNLNGTKTDLYLKQESTLETKISEDGTITNTLKIHRSNPLEANEKLTNLSFVRILVPNGSKLISTQGFSYVNLDTKYGAEGKVSDDVEEWEKKSVKDVVSGTMIGEEAGYTYFGNWIEVKGGESKTVTLNYTLPFKLEDIDRYSLYLQKQPGTKNFEFSHNMTFTSRNIEWQNFSPENLESNSYSARLILDKDYLLGSVLHK